MAWIIAMMSVINKYRNIIPAGMNNIAPNHHNPDVIKNMNIAQKYVIMLNGIRIIVISMPPKKFAPQTQSPSAQVFVNVSVIAVKGFGGNVAPKKS
jgi:hypothetical protein